MFNRIIGKRIAVIDDFPGVTRDRNYHKAEWNGSEFMLVDTGGLIPTVHESIPDAIHEQVRIAMEESLLVLLVVDAETGPTDLDLMIADELRKNHSERTLLVVNKAESQKVMFEIGEYWQLGLGEPLPISALHGKGVADLLDKITDAIVRSQDEHQIISAKPDISLKLTIVGRPNAGKSSLVNKLLHKNRMIVDAQPGTTRDAIDTSMLYNNQDIVLVDTAGLRKKSRVHEDMEYYSNLRTINSIERSDVVVLMIDGTAGIGIQDLRILRKIYEQHKGVLLAWNKWDIVEKDHATFDHLRKEAIYKYKELKPVPMVAISAKTGQRVTAIIDTAIKIKERLVQKVSGAQFENLVFEWIRTHPHPVITKGMVRFLGAKQVKAPYPLFRFFVTNPKNVTPAYERYLVNKIYGAFDFTGCPVTVEFRSASRPRRTKITTSGNEAFENWSD